MSISGVTESSGTVLSSVTFDIQYIAKYSSTGPGPISHTVSDPFLTSVAGETLVAIYGGGRIVDWTLFCGGGHAFKMKPLPSKTKMKSDGFTH